MTRNHNIVFIRNNEIKTYSNLRKCCEKEGLVYNTIVRQKFPIIKTDYEIQKTEYL